MGKKQGLWGPILDCSAAPAGINGNKGPASDPYMGNGLSTSHNFLFGTVPSQHMLE